MNLKAVMTTALLSALSLGGLRAQTARDLAHAIRANDLAKVKAIIEAEPASLHQKIEFHNYPLFVAITEFKIDSLRYFLEKGAKVNAVDDEGENAAHQFAKLKIGPTVIAQAKEMFQLILDQKVNLNLLNKHGKTPLYLIAGGNNRNISKPDTKVELLKFLVDHGADVNARGKEVSPLLVDVVRFAAARGNEEVAAATIRFLLENGIKVNDADADGNAALYRVLKPTQVQMELPADKKAEYAALLIDHGADPKQKNLKKESPMTLIENKEDPLYEILRRKPAKAGGKRK